jgi:chaperone protein EcpD
MFASRSLPRRGLALAGMLCGLAAAQAAHAGIVLNGTRVVFPAEQREVTVKVSNEGQHPELVQAWIDRGDTHADPASTRVPFVLTPPVARLDPGKAQALRILFDGEALPQDKESVFWLNVLDIPPKPSAQAEADHNLLQMAVRSRIKLFYRPAKLPGDPAEAPAKLHWTLVRQGGHTVLQATNPTPYAVSFAQIAVASGSESTTAGDGGMVEPGATATFALHGSVKGASPHVRYQAINDYGGVSAGDAALEAESRPPAAA